MSYKLLLSTLALAVACSASQAFRWPYHPSPFVVANNPRDNLPDFQYFDALNATLTPSTIACPGEMIRHCSKDQKTHDEACGSDGLHACKGGLWCDISHHNMKARNLTDTYCPHYDAGHSDIKVVPRTRRNILQRAVGWLAVHAPYFGCHVPKFKYDGLEMCGEDDGPLCPQFGYTLTCEGLISMAYGVPGYGGSPSEAIHYSSLLPGDSVPVEKYKQGKKQGTSHYLMFREWIEVNKTARLYQMGGGHGDTNMIVLSNIRWCADRIPRNGECHGASKYKHVKPE